MQTDKLIEHTINKRTESQEEKPQTESIVEDWRINGDTVEYKTVIDGWVELGTYDEVRDLYVSDELDSDDISEVRSVIEQQWRGDGWNVEYQPVDRKGIDDAFVIPFADPLEPVIVQPALGDDVPEEHTEELEEEYSLFELESMDLITEDGDNLVREYDSLKDVIFKETEDINMNPVRNIDIAQLYYSVLKNNIINFCIAIPVIFVFDYFLGVAPWSIMSWLIIPSLVYFLTLYVSSVLAVYVDSEYSKTDYDEYETIYSSSSNNTSTSIKYSQQDQFSTPDTEYQCMECGCSADESDLLLIEGDKPFHESSVNLVCQDHTEYGMEYIGTIEEKSQGVYVPEVNTGVEVEGKFESWYDKSGDNTGKAVVKHKSDELSEDDIIYFNSGGRRYKGSVIESHAVFSTPSDQSNNVVLVSVDENLGRKLSNHHY
jgi:hypothetical protein